MEYVLLLLYIKRRKWPLGRGANYIRGECPWGKYPGGENDRYAHTHVHTHVYMFKKKTLSQVLYFKEKLS